MNRTLISRAMRQLARQRWAKPGATNPGRPRSKDRCPCGKYTKHTAAIRKHSCSPPETQSPLMPPAAVSAAAAPPLPYRPSNTGS